MVRIARAFGLLILAGTLVGCGGDSAPPADQNSANSGISSSERMKNEIGIPGPDGKMIKSGEAPK